MEGFKVGDRVRPLPDGERYGPKYWKLTLEDGKRVWIEIRMSKEEKDFERLTATLLSADPTSPSVRTAAITEADAEKFPGLKSYIDGFAIFPSVPFHPVGSPEQRKLEDAWGVRSLETHSRQESLPTLADKPADDSTTGLYFQELRRGD